MSIYDMNKFEKQTNKEENISWYNRYDWLIN